MNGARLRRTPEGRSVVDFSVWAPHPHQIGLRLFRRDGSREEVPMRREISNHPNEPELVGAPERDPLFADLWRAALPADAGDRYAFVVEGRQLPDPAARLLPAGVHGPAEIVDPTSFTWTDTGWRGVPFREYVIYELHVGTFTPAGTFDGVIEKLDYLRQLGITAIELMPVNAFPGERNWGYDGVGLYAVQASYGGPEGLRRLVNEAHRRGLAVVLDVVYNHLGNEGNYLRDFGPYFTARHHTPWSEAVNYDDEGSAGVRRFIVENALYWLRDYHLDGLRLDAVQTIRDDSPRHIVAEIAERAHALGRDLDRAIAIMAETDENDARYVLPREKGGYGVDAIWSDDFHHSLHALTTGERAGYYQDFGDVRQVVKALNEGFVFQGEFFGFWKDVRGTSANDVPPQANIVAIQNHDQVGNRARGERLTALVPRGARKALAAVLLLAPQTPLLFMGQEFDHEAPFQFFTDFGDPTLQKAVSEGRRREFQDFDFSEVPDPQHPETFARSQLRWEALDQEMLEWYRALLRLRREFVVESAERSCRAELDAGESVLRLDVPRRNPRLLLICALRSGSALPDPSSDWTLRLKSEEDGYGCAVFTH